MGKRIGLLLRSYAKTPAEVPGVVARAIKSVTHASNLIGQDGEAVFQTVVVLIPRDYDCGLTARALQKELKLFEDCGVNVAELEAYGHHSSGALNNAVTVLDSYSFDRVVMVSNKAIQALTARSVEAMIEAFDRGAKVVGVAVDELQNVVLEGRIQNTFAGWDVPALLAVGGFDSEKGVEEISPIVRLIRQYGQCVAIIDPKEKPALDIRKTTDGDARHQEVMTTKITHQREEVQRFGADFDFIKSGIMPEYPQSV